MDEIELVVKIPEDVYRYAKKYNDSSMLTLREREIGMCMNTIANGTPLPKDYERLIDEKILLRKLRSRNFGFNLPTWVKVAIDDTPTIIEADKRKVEK